MSSTGLSGDTSIGDWFDHPQGGPVLRKMLADNGQSESVMRPVRRFAMKRLIKLSKGQFTQEIIDDLVRQAEAYVPGEGEAQAAPASGSGNAAEAVDLPEWQEAVTAGRFTGKTVIVTGAGSGIGRATASRVAREGGRVIAVDVVEGGLAEFADEHKGLDVVTVRGDITSEADVARIVAAAGGAIDGLANVAGIMDKMAGIAAVTDEVWDRVIAVNVTGMMRLTRAVLPAMLAAHKGSIVNITSEAGIRGSAAGVAYTASKHAVVGMTKSTAFIYGPQGVRVNAVAPGGVATGIEGTFSDPVAGERIGLAMTVLPPIADPEHLAASITFLLSDDGVNLNGVILPSDGGWSAV
ncbi:SDR family NAD(P)-dependent oxidoreductase [Demequina sp.]|uniref:SDR family NAD(P)-dependent oxidoreductase n=1 Tax=Demequina sp. TaxID=2050685 RepID=UPI003D0D563B